MKKSLDVSFSLRRTIIWLTFGHCFFALFRSSTRQKTNLIYIKSFAFVS